MIIDNTYFHSSILIPNVNITGVGSVNINRLIESECYSFLNSLLGNEIYNDLEGYFDSNLDLLPNAPQKYLELFYGKKYDDKKWNGLIIKKKLGNYSLLADWVWLKWYEDNVTLTSNNGQVVLDTKNASRVNPTEKYVHVWNELVKKVDSFTITERPTISYPSCYKFIDYYVKNKSINVSLSEYLNDFKEDFPNPSLITPNGEELKIKNIFGL